MPKDLENKLKKEAKAKGLTGKRYNAYVYGTLYKIEMKQKTKRAKVSRRSKNKKRVAK